MSILLLPMWILSGAMFPPSDDHPVLQTLMHYNPMSYMVSGVRHALHASDINGANWTTLSGSLTVDFIWVLVFAAFSVAAATILIHRRR